MRNYLCKLKLKTENCKIFCFFLTLFSIISVFEAKNTCFLLIPVKFVAVLKKIKFFEKSKMAAKMADML